MIHSKCIRYVTYCAAYQAEILFSLVPNKLSKILFYRFHSKGCKDVHWHREVAKQHQCQMPIFYTGKHLDDLGLSELPICNKTSILKGLLLDKAPSCSNSVPCEHTEYSIDADFSNDEHYDLTGYVHKKSFSLIYNLPLTEHYRSSVKVTEQTLIGSFGGILGITLGWSGYDIVGIIDGIVSYLMNVIPLLS